MTTADQYIDEAYEKLGTPDSEGVYPNIRDCIKEVMQSYAREVVQQALKDAADECSDDELQYVDYYDFSKGVESVPCSYKQSILSIEIKLP